MWRSILLAFAALISVHLDWAHAEPGRYALLIGNASYSETVGALKNPHNDVALIAASLKKIGFDVTVVRDATYRSLDVEVRRHATKLRNAGENAIGFFYYSGHGVANPETSANYLIPVDVRSIADREVWLYAFEQKTVIDKLSSIASNATHFVVFDACRDELRTPEAPTKSAAKAKGFVPIASKAGLLIAYSTAPGRTASDEGLGGGPYASVLAQELTRPGIEAVSMFRNVQLRVRAKIKQDPWLSFPALPEIYLAGKDGEAADRRAERVTVAPDSGTATTGAVAPMSAAAKAWAITQHSDNATILEAFAKEFPDSIFAKFARARIGELKARKSISGAPPQGPVVVAAQRELKRLGCYEGPIDGKWGPQSMLAITRLNQSAKTRFDTDGANEDTLAVLRTIKTPICDATNQASMAPSGEGATEPERRPSGGSQPSRRTYRRGYRGGTCRDGNLDHCDLGCRKGYQRSCRRARELRAQSRGSHRGLCGDGNIDHCEFSCARGRQSACRRLSRSR